MFCFRTHLMPYGQTLHIDFTVALTTRKILLLKELLMQHATDMTFHMYWTVIAFWWSLTQKDHNWLPP